MTAYAESIRAAKAHATVFEAPDGRMHAYTGCAGAGRQPHILTVGVLAEIPEARVCGCLRHRWTAYRTDLDLAA